MTKYKQGQTDANALPYSLTGKEIVSFTSDPNHPDGAAFQDKDFAMSLEDLLAFGNFNPADYPAVKFYLPLDEDYGTVIKDPILNQEIDIEGWVGGPSKVLWGLNYLYTDDAAAIRADNATITLPDLGNTKDTLMMVVADLTLDDLPISVGGADPAAALLKINRKTGGSGSVMRDILGNLDTIPISDIDDTTQAYMIYSDRNDTRAFGSARIYEAETDGTTASDSADIPFTAVGGMDLDVPGSAAKFSFNTGINLYSLVVMSFDTLPSSQFLLDMMAWMNTRARAGDKSLYPGLKGLT